jgi:excisionase family DNA binding protein
MTVTEASKMIGISNSKLYQLVAARKITHYRVGGKIIFHDEDVAAFLTSCRVGMAAPARTAPPTRLHLKHLVLHGA